MNDVLEYKVLSFLCLISSVLLFFFFLVSCFWTFCFVPGVNVPLCGLALQEMANWMRCVNVGFALIVTFVVFLGFSFSLFLFYLIRKEAV